MSRGADSAGEIIPGDSVQSTCGGRHSIVLHCVRGSFTYGYSHALTLPYLRAGIESREFRKVTRRVGHERLPNPRPR